MTPRKEPLFLLQTNICKALLVLVCMVFFNHYNLTAQTNIGFENYSTSNGMARNRITCITQDKQGYIWLGPQPDGLTRFDGYRFSVFLNNPQDSNSIKYTASNSLFGDAEGNVWIATVKGVQVYTPSDGHFSFPSKIFNTPKLLDTAAVDYISADASGKIWFLTERHGLISLDLKTKQSKLFFQHEPLTNRLITGCQDKNGNLWILSNLCLLTIYKNGEIRQIPFADSNLIRYSFAAYNQEIAVDNDGQVWLEMGDGSAGLFSIGQTAVLIKKLPGATAKNGISVQNVISLMIDKDGYLWIGTFGSGLYLYDKTKDSLIAIKHNDGDRNSLPGDFVKTIYQDRQGIIWIGTYGSGLAKYDPAAHQFETVKKLFDNPNSLPGNDITSAWALNPNEIFIGSRGNGFSYWNRQTNKFTNYKTNTPILPHGLPNNFVYDFTTDSLGDIWICTHGGFCRYNKNTGPNNAFTVFPPPNGAFTSFFAKRKQDWNILCFATPIFDKSHLLVGSIGGLCVFNIASKQWEALPDANHILETNQGLCTRAWVKDGHFYWLPMELKDKLVPICRYDAVKKELIPIDLILGDKHIAFIKGIALDSNGTHLWIASHEGLIYFDKTKLTIEKIYTIKDGLADNLCVSIVMFGKDEVWVGTAGGLSRFIKSTQKFTTFDKSYGIVSNEFNNTAAKLISNDEVMFGAINGVNIFKPLALKSNNYSPDVTITGIKLEGVPEAMHTNTNAGVNLQSQQNFFTITYSALNYSHTEKTTYQYLLKDIDKDWVNAGTQNFATYTNLPPGNYVFNVKATNADGIATKHITQLQIIILPAWYQTWWFRWLVVLSVCSLVVGFAKWRINGAKKEGLQKAQIEKLSAAQYKSQMEIATAKQQVKTAQLDALRSQMDPHFIFNSLNSIENFILKNERVLASEYLGKFSKLIRNILDNSKKETVPIAQEIETLKIYIELERLRMGNSFEVCYKIEHGLHESDIEIPPMLMQPYVENAILHGIRYRTDGKGKLLVEIFIAANGSLHYVVQDNGIGRANAAIENKDKKNGHQSYGTAITQSRIDIYNQLKNADVTVTTSDVQPFEGTKVELIIPQNF